MSSPHNKKQQTAKMSSSAPAAATAAAKQSSASGGGSKTPVKNQTSSSHPKHNPGKRQKHLGINNLVELLELPSNSITLTLLNPRFKLANFLQQKARPSGDQIEQMVAVLNRAFSCHSLKIQLSGLANQIAASKFFNEHVHSCLEQNDSNRNLLNVTFLRSVLNLCSSFVLINPSIVNGIKKVTGKLQLMFAGPLVRDENLKAEWEFFYMTKLARHNYINYNYNHANLNHQHQSNLSSDQQQPPNDFTQLSIVPSLGDIINNNNEPFLRKNIINGPYSSVHHYLDVHFRLLREDFIQPLRNGVKELNDIMISSGCNRRANLDKETKEKIKRIDSLNAYFDVRMKACVTTDLGMCYSMKLSSESMSAINWETSKRLIFGSLVCFSSDFFTNNCLIGVICARDEKTFMKTGEIYVKFEAAVSGEHFGQQLFPVFNESYIMLETSAFFEAYRHVLDALVSLQRRKPSEFPFKENIVDCQNSHIDPPRYLTNALFDFA
jgi:hypothetical protein